MQKNKSIILYVIFFLLLISCHKEPNPCKLSMEVLKDVHKLDSFIRIPAIIERDKEWMKNNYNEPSILSAKTETYRFIWASSFVSDTTLIFRIEKRNGHYKAIKKVFPDNRDTVVVKTEFEISKDVWSNIVNGLAASNFWTYPTSSSKRVLDGASWLLEGYKPIKDKCTLNNYHRVGRVTSSDTAFISMCKLLYELKEN